MSEEPQHFSELRGIFKGMDRPETDGTRIARLEAEIERLRAKIVEMGKCCSAQEHDQIGCRCANEQNENK